MTDPQSGSSGAPQWQPAEPVPTEPFVSPFAGQAPTQPPPPWGAPVFAAPEPPPAAPKPPSTRRSSGAGMIVSAVLATAVLASGGTYLAMNAAGLGRTAATQPPVFTPTAAGPGAQPSQAPNAVAPGAQQPQGPAATSAPAATAAPAAPVAPATGQGSVVDIVKAVSPAVVTIVAEGVTATNPITGQTGTGTATGSGVIFDANGLILTNHHVVEGSPSKLTVNLKDGRSFDATIYGVDTLTDLAIVKVDATGLPTAPIGDSSTVQVGQQAIAIGSPLGEFTDSVTSGIVSAIGRSIPVETGVLNNLIQTDTAINPGNSGGPLLDPSGSVIGINTAVASDSQGIGFAIPINIARPLLAQASAGQKLARPWLGIVFQTITPAIKNANGLTVDNGAWIPTAAALAEENSLGQDPDAQGGQGTQPFDPFGQDQDPRGSGGTGGSASTQQTVVAGSPAEQAGLKAGDVITAINGTALDAAHPLDLVMSQNAPGQTITLDALRDGQTISVSVTLATRPAIQ